MGARKNKQFEILIIDTPLAWQEYLNSKNKGNIVPCVAWTVYNSRSHPLSEKSKRVLELYFKEKRGEELAETRSVQTVSEADLRAALAWHHYYFEGGKDEQREYHSRDDVKERERARQRTEPFKASKRVRETSAEYRAWQREYKKRKYWEKKQAALAQQNKAST